MTVVRRYVYSRISVRFLGCWLESCFLEVRVGCVILLVGLGNGRRSVGFGARILALRAAWFCVLSARYSYSRGFGILRVFMWFICICRAFICSAFICLVAMVGVFSRARAFA